MADTLRERRLSVKYSEEQYSGSDVESSDYRHIWIWIAVGFVLTVAAAGLFAALR